MTTMEKVITLTELLCNNVITKDFVDECKGEILSKIKKLKYNSRIYYSAATIALVLDTLSIDERKEILDVLNLQEK